MQSQGYITSPGLYLGTRRSDGDISPRSLERKSTHKHSVVGGLTPTHHALYTQIQKRNNSIQRASIRHHVPIKVMGALETSRSHQGTSFRTHSSFSKKGRHKRFQELQNRHTHSFALIRQSVAGLPFHCKRRGSCKVCVPEDVDGQASSCIADCRGRGSHQPQSQGHCCVGETSACTANCARKANWKG
jgi:hypothetical protein